MPFSSNETNFEATGPLTLRDSQVVIKREIKSFKTMKLFK